MKYRIKVDIPGINKGAILEDFDELGYYKFNEIYFLPSRFPHLFEPIELPIDRIMGWLLKFDRKGTIENSTMKLEELAETLFHLGVNIDEEVSSQN